VAALSFAVTAFTVTAAGAHHQGVYGIAREDGRKRPDALWRAI